MSRKSGRKKGTSIRSRIVAVMLVGIATTTVLLTIGSAWREAQRFAEAKRAEIEGTAAVLASAVADAVATGDRYGALKALRAIGRIPSFEYARVTTSNGRTLADLGGATTLSESPDLPILLRRSLSVTMPVLKDGNEIGAVTVLVNTGELRNRLRDGVQMGLLAALLSAGLGIIVAFRLQDRITRPLRKLTSTMSEIQKTNNFSNLVDHDATDETGILVEAFNGMMSEIQQRDMRLARHRETLEQTVEERTADLRLAKDAAEHANAAKSEFLATMSHEIRTPMNGMLVMAELLASARLDERHRRYADVVLKSGQSLLTIINDILDFSKIEAGKLELECIAFDPADVIDDVLNLFWERAVSKGIDLAGYVAPDVPRAILGDPVRLNQVVSNLVNNALKFTETGHVMVRVEAEGAAPDGGCRLRFRVRDTGIGIPREKLAAVFESFSQADQTTTRKYGGTGLGLAICKRLVEAMHGAIGVTSTVGHGSEFHFTIDVPEAASEGFVEAPPPVRRLERAVVCLAGAATREVIAAYLADRGIVAQMIEEGALSPAQVEGADLVLADVSAAALLARLRGGQPGADEPFLVCLSQIGDNRSDGLIADGRAQDRLMRPVARAAMEELLDRLAQNAPRGRAILDQREARRLPSYQGVRVLVADDSPINREVVFEALKQLGVRADLVEDGAAAIEAAAREAYDLILMDCSMPEMDGFEATRRIRRREADTGAAPVPIVALTAHIAGGRADEWQRAGMDDYITKPFRVTDLARCFDRFLADRKTEAPEGKEQAGYAAAAPSSALPREFTGQDGELPVIDHDILDAVAACGSEGQDLFVRVLSLFREHAPRALLTLAEAARDGDAKAIADGAHALKSMCRNIGAQRLGEACHRLEAEANAGELASLAARLAEFPGLLMEVLDQIKDMQPAQRRTGTR